MKKKLLGVLSILLLSIIIFTGCHVQNTNLSENDYSSVVTTENTAVKSTNKSTTMSSERTTEPTTIQSLNKTITTINQMTTESPKESDDLATILEENESGNNLVWIPTNGGKKYHSNPDCSNMHDPIQVSLDTAIEEGYTACKRCY